MRATPPFWAHSGLALNLWHFLAFFHAIFGFYLIKWFLCILGPPDRATQLSPPDPKVSNFFVDFKNLEISQCFANRDFAIMFHKLRFRYVSKTSRFRYVSKPRDCYVSQTEILQCFTNRDFAMFHKPREYCWF